MSEEFRPGLEGVVVAETRLSYINGETGTLRVGGFPIAELAQDATYEMSVYLLLYGHPPTATELADFRERLAGERRLPEEVHDLLRAAAAAALPAMDAIRMGAAAANLGRDTEDDHAEARRIIACFPTIVAAYWRYRQGEDPVAPREDLGHTANYLYMLTGSEPTETAVQGLETYLNTVIDHGLNASTFSARVAVSTESDLVSAATAAVSTLKGPLHGGAPGPVLEMIRDVHASGDPEGYVREVLDAGQRLMGFGHRVYRVRDPRAAVLEAAAEQFFETGGDADLFRTARRLEAVATELLAEHKPDHRVETNVEFYTALLLNGVGIPEELFTATFAVARVGGWMAHALEQRADNRLIRPTSRYVGEERRTWPALTEP
jgi:citrate synthase